MNPNDDRELEHSVDVGSQRIARVYAEALFRATPAQQTEAVFEEFDSLICDVFPADPEFEVFLASAAIGRRHKADVLKSVFEKRARAVFFHFLMVLNEHERLDLLRPIHAGYKELLDEQARRIRILVETAVPMADDQRERLSHGLREAFHMEPVLEMRVDADLLGGLVVRIGDWLFDGSVRSKLANLCNQIIERSSHEIQSGRDRFSIS
jgi:F-type H+-transporting ATPase subunit delta